MDDGEGEVPALAISTLGAVTPAFGARSPVSKRANVEMLLQDSFGEV